MDEGVMFYNHSKIPGNKIVVGIKTDQPLIDYKMSVTCLDNLNPLTKFIFLGLCKYKCTECKNYKSDCIKLKYKNYNGNMLFEFDSLDRDLIQSEVLKISNILGLPLHYCAAPKL